MQDEKQTPDSEEPVDTKQMKTTDILKAKILGPLASIQKPIKKVKGTAGMIGAMQGVIGDLASPLGAVVLLFTGVGFVVTGFAGYRWFGRDKKVLQVKLDDGTLTLEAYNDEAGSNIWALCFSFAMIMTVILTFFLIIGSVGSKGKKGFLATKIPGLASMQNSLFNLKKEVKKIKKDVKKIKTDVTQLKKQGGIISSPSQAKDFLHNAKVFMGRNERGKSRKAYQKYMTYQTKYIDPHIAYQALLKDTEGISKSRQIYQQLAAKYPNKFSFQYASALLLENKQQLARMKALLEKNPDYLPAIAAISKLYSHQVMGSQTMSDRRREMKYLNLFVKKNGPKRYLSYFINQLDAKKDLDGIMTRHRMYAKGILGKMAKKTVTVRANTVTGGFYQVTFIIMEQVKEIWYKKEGGSEFKSTGFMPTKNPITGLPYPNYTFTTAGMKVGTNKLQVKYKNIKDQIVGPVSVSFTIQSQGSRMQTMWLTYQWRNPIFKRVRYRQFRGGLNLLVMWANNPKLFSKVKYSLDNKSLGKTLIENGRGKFVLNIRNVSPGSHTFHIQWHMASGQKSAVLQYKLNVLDNPKWQWGSPQ